jgi:hypothetical protein
MKVMMMMMTMEMIIKVIISVCYKVTIVSKCHGNEQLFFGVNCGNPIVNERKCDDIHSLIFSEEIGSRLVQYCEHLRSI